MDVKVKKDAEEEMNCILDLLEEWCLKYDQDYANAVVLVKHDQITSWGSMEGGKNDQITSWGSIGNHEDFDVYRTKSAHKRRRPLGRITKQPRLLQQKG